MENVNNRLLYSIIGSVAAAAVVGGVGLAMGQSAMEERVKTVEAVQKESRAAVNAIPVMANEIAHIKSDIEDIDEKQDEILDAIRSMDR